MLAKYCPDLLVLAIPLRNKFRGITLREVALFRGEAGWSEFSPFLEYGVEEAATWMRASLEAANTSWPPLFRDRVAINATLPIVEPTQVPEILKRFSGSTTVKIKVDDFDSGAKVVEAVLSFNAEMKIRLDVNGSWSSEQAIKNLRSYYQRFGDLFEYVEQPSTTLEELAEVKAQSPIPVAVDESIRKHLSGNFQNFSRYADVAILKWQPCGGFLSAHKISQEIGLPVVVSSALETGIGISHGLALAASFQGADAACGLGTVALLEGDISSPQALVEDGYMEVKRREPVDFERYLANSERREHWQRRIVSVLEFIEGRRI